MDRRITKATADRELLEIEVERAGADIAVVSVAGELDLSTIVRLEPMLLGEAASRDRMVIDMSRLTFIDSTGISLLIRAHKATDGRAPMHTVIAPGSQVERVLGVAGVDRVLRIYRDRESAIAALAPPR